jgi:phospholipid/cholesterol/gamma-HCH transport system substrate-binding protein
MPRLPSAAPFLRLSGTRRVPHPALIPRLVAALLMAALAAGAVAFWPREDRIRVTGDFSRAVGLYEGSDVRILGVRVGTVLRVVPRGERVAVTFEYDARHSVPADAKAVIVAPSLVSDRYVQLFPAYTGGPKLRDGDRIGLQRTAVPVELDRVSQSLDDLLVALGPEGANRDGALSRLLETGAANLEGQGASLGEMNHELSLAVQTLSGGREDMFSTVKSLQAFTTMLATNDAQVRRLNSDLASVSVQLEGERDDLAAALANLAVALEEVSTFVHDNRALLSTNIDQLAAVTTTVASQRDALAETLTNAPVALSNLQNAYNPQTGTLDTRNNAEQFEDPALFLCALVTGPSGTGNTELCEEFEALLGPMAAQGSGGAGPVAVHGADPTLGGLLGEAP